MFAAATADFHLRSEVTHDTVNNRLFLRKQPKQSDDSSEDASHNTRYFNPRDRNGRVLPGRYTTSRVEDATLDYLAATHGAEQAVRLAVGKLSSRLADRMPDLVHAAHMTASLGALRAHAAAAHQNGWCLPMLVPFPKATGTLVSAPHEESDDILLSARGLKPFWLATGASPGRGVGCDVDLRAGELVLLTAPNMR